MGYLITHEIYTASGLITNSKLLSAPRIYTVIPADPNYYNVVISANIIPQPNMTISPNAVLWQIKCDPNINMGRITVGSLNPTFTFGNLASFSINENSPLQGMNYIINKDIYIEWGLITVGDGDIRTEVKYFKIPK